MHSAINISLQELNFTSVSLSLEGTDRTKESFKFLVARPSLCPSPLQLGLDLLAETMPRSKYGEGWLRGGHATAAHDLIRVEESCHMALHA